MLTLPVIRLYRHGGTSGMVDIEQAACPANGEGQLLLRQCER